ncbi:sulfite reductase (NADPH) flavoprotein alpha-component [Sphingomonas sp. SORGH_AS 950]|uniref:sulfite reductase flavoprotein subunit alpha n=1 Tax=Sphingomonas sp. SORGH_AS_0950 TaxID=3041792 RepID=UPI002786BDDF|nr:sulfite reductase flavoprotein subunit alpha [Sphingomonas sp. SORGH_AS_0950]MDQ1159135.1 sulfite reductase (NADPH) flavoprotein alpha-component [Sphingomonas sp. SORGH_AS_0950]
MISTRTILFQVHWFLGITAGLVLAVMGVTGALISFEPEILAATNPGIVTVTPGRTPPLPAPALIARIQAEIPGLRIQRLIVERDPTRAATVGYTIGDSKKRERAYVDPATGALLGEPRGSGFFETVENLHRWLALPGKGNGIGRQLTGFAALSLIFFALSGLYLRWPRRPLDWRNWLVLDLRKTGRNLYRALHAVVGGWVLLFYLISAGTGLWWSYGWYRDGVRHLLTTEQVEHGRRGGGAKDARPDLPRAWNSFTQATGGRDYERITASVRDGAVQFRAKLPGGRHDRVSDEVTVDGATGRIVSDTPYATRPLGDDIVTSVYEIHRGAYFGLVGRIVMALTSLTMPLFTVTGFLLYFARRRRKKALGAVLAETPVAAPETTTTLVAYASQTGSAERIARLTAQALPDAAAVPVTALDPARLAGLRQLFVVASTYGEGEPPDAARGFARTLAEAPGDLSHLRYAVLALGDREYSDFCAFGHQIDRWLHAGGAERLFDAIELDGDDADAQRLWQQQLASLGARTDQPDWTPAPMADWRLVERRLLNPGSHGGPTWHVALAPVDGAAEWAAGDILEILPQQDVRRVIAFLATTGLPDTPAMRARLMTSILPPKAGPGFDPDTLRPLAHREYSIASIAAAGRVELIVRLCTAEDGLPGLGSGWLCGGAAIGSVVKARVHANPAFHSPADPAMPIVLIGNGTGLAGLMGHLRQRAATGGGPAWLFWGERHPDHDDYHAAERRALGQAGVLTGMASAWSRLGTGPRYVQDVVAMERDTIRAAVAAGATLYVCGSLKGMAGDVHRTLTELLGDAALEEMAATGRYARDIY